jgi:hypothetical protein
MQERYGRWTVIGEPTPVRAGSQMRPAVPCRCDCGTERLVLVQSLTRKDRANPSCGCWRREQSATQARQQFTRHGKARASGKDPLYLLWKRVMRRCYDPTTHNYRWYGGRGIGVFEPWRTDAGAFIDWIEQNLGPRPSPRHSINRVDNDGDYEPGNLDWATPLQQVHNSRPWLERHGGAGFG